MIVDDANSQHTIIILPKVGSPETLKRIIRYIRYSVFTIEEQVKVSRSQNEIVWPHILPKMNKLISFSNKCWYWGELKSIDFRQMKI